MTAEDDALREARKQVGEMYLASHLEKHEMEAEQAETHLAHNMERLAEHRRAHDLEHGVHQRDHGQYRDSHSTEHRMEQVAVTTALEAVARERQIHAEAHAREHLNHEQIHVLAQRAVDKAEMAVETRLHTMNEVRDQLREQAGSFVHREVLDAFIGRYERAHDDVLQLVATEREERRANEGTKRGVSSSIGWVIAAISAAATILGIVIVIMNLVTQRV